MIGKTYGNCACAEAVCDMEAMMSAFERVRSSRDVDVPSTSLDANCATGGLSSNVRQLVTDSKNLVAGALTSSFGREARLRADVETAMHTLAGVFAHCCRQLAFSAVEPPPPSPGAVADVADCVLEAAGSLRATIKAVRALLEAGSDAGETERQKNAVLATAAVLAKSLSVLVQKVKTI